MKKLNLNLGCGGISYEGFVNVDKFGNPDIKHDLDIAPYPWEDNSVDFILCSHILEHLKEPEQFFSEIKRILKPGGRAKIIVPHKNAGIAYSTFGHRGFYHEHAIDNVCVPEGSLDDSSTTTGFRLISKKVVRGRFLKWQKRGIIWIIEKKK